MALQAMGAAPRPPPTTAGRRRRAGKASGRHGQSPLARSSPTPASVDARRNRLAARQGFALALRSPDGAPAGDRTPPCQDQGHRTWAPLAAPPPPRQQPRAARGDWREGCHHASACRCCPTRTSWGRGPPSARSGRRGPAAVQGAGRARRFSRRNQAQRPRQPQAWRRLSATRAFQLPPHRRPEVPWQLGLGDLRLGSSSHCGRGPPNAPREATRRFWNAARRRRHPMRGDQGCGHCRHHRRACHRCHGDDRLQALCPKRHRATWRRSCLAALSPRQCPPTPRTCPRRIPAPRRSPLQPNAVPRPPFAAASTASYRPPGTAGEPDYWEKKRRRGAWT
mmetsp:Transcript_111960/g.316476  ORF Transcript_111960/g.316476 Transcript_111960/m.316476 type:complete len:337 (-) Transcript_111960:2-1012(-)